MLLAFASTAHAVQTVVDDLGRRIALPHGAERIVALDPSTVEILFAVGAGGKIVATTPYANFPPDAARITKIDSLSPSRELLFGLRPDLIIASDQTLNAEKADAKARLWGAPVFVTNANSYEAVERDIQLVGGYFGDPKLVKRTIDDMTAALADVRRRIAGRPKPTVFDVVWVKPLMTAGQDSFISSLIALAGGIDVGRTAPKYSEYPVEQLVAANPDFILVAAESLPAARQSFGMLRLRALATNRLAPIPDDLTVRPGPRLAQGLRLLARILHPEAFAAK